MAKVLCVKGVTFGATGETYEAGQEYSVKEATLKAYPDYFERLEAAKAEDK
jgi:hypothetical protein